MKRRTSCFVLLVSAAFLGASGVEAAGSPGRRAAGAWTISCDSAPWRTAPNPAFGEKERLEYRVSWGAIKAGSGVIAVNGIEPVHGRPAYHLSLEIGTTGVTAALHAYQERTDTWLDQPSIETVRYTKQTREGHYARDESVELDQACRRFDRQDFRIDKNLLEKKQGRLPPDTLDILGYLFYLRTLPLAEGGHYDLTLLSGDTLWPVTVHVVRRLKISTPIGWFDCFFLVPELRDAKADIKLKQLEVWISADPRHIPVRLRMEANVGHITAQLVSKGETSP